MNLKQRRVGLFVLLACLRISLIVCSKSDWNSEAESKNLEEPSLEIYFDLKSVNASLGVVSFPSKLTFREIGGKIIDLCGSSVLQEQLTYSHRMLTNKELNLERVTPLMLGLEGYTSSDNQPAGPIKVGLGYKVFITVNDNSKTLFALDLDVTVKVWTVQTLDSLKESGMLYIGSKIVSEVITLRNAFKGLINEDSKEIKGDIIIKLSEFVRIYDSKGDSRTMKISQTTTLEMVLTKLDAIYPKLQLLKKKMLCLNPSCMKYIRKLDTVFGKYQLSEYQKLYIPGTIEIEFENNATGKKSSFEAVRFMTVNTLFDVVRGLFFPKKLKTKVVLHSMDPNRPLVLDSEKGVINNTTFIADFEIYKYKVIENGGEGCKIEIKSTLASVVKDSFVGEFPCSTTLSEIQDSAHKYFSNPYSERLYVNDSDLLAAPPGIIEPEVSPKDIPVTNFLNTTIQQFRSGDKTGAIIFNYKYQIVVRYEHTDTEDLSDNGFKLWNEPLNALSGPIAKKIYQQNFIDSPEFAYIVPLKALSSYRYMSLSDMSVEGKEFSKVFTPFYPAVIVYAYKSSTYTDTTFKGDYVGQAFLNAPHRLRFTDLDILTARHLLKVGGEKFRDCQIKMTYKDNTALPKEDWIKIRAKSKSLKAVITIQSKLQSCLKKRKRQIESE